MSGRHWAMDRDIEVVVDTYTRQEQQLLCERLAMGHCPASVDGYCIGGTGDGHCLG